MNLQNMTIRTQILVLIAASFMTIISLFSTAVYNMDDKQAIFILAILTLCSLVFGVFFCFLIIRKISQSEAGEISGLSGLRVAEVEKAGGMLKNLFPDTRKPSELDQKTSVVRTEQNSGVNLINGALQHLDTVVQQNATSSEKLALSSEELSAQALQLQENLAFFIMRQDGSYRTSASIPTASPGEMKQPKPEHLTSVSLENGSGKSVPCHSQIQKKSVCLDLSQSGEHSNPKCDRH